MDFTDTKTAFLSSSTRGSDLGVVLLWTLLAAASVRITAAVADAIVAWTREPHTSFGIQLGSFLLDLGDFADGQGVLLLLAVLGLFWWKRGVLGSKQQRVVLIWLTTLFGVSVLGAVVIAVGTVVYYSGVGSVRLSWSHYVGSGGFALANAIVAIGGTFVAYEELRRTAKTNDPDPVSSPYLGSPPSVWPNAVDVEGPPAT